MKRSVSKKTIADFLFEKGFSLMPDVSYLSVEGIDVEDSMKGARVSSLDAIETLSESGIDEVYPLISHHEEVGSQFYGR